VGQCCFFAVHDILQHLVTESTFNSGLKLREGYFIVTVGIHVDVPKELAIELFEDLTRLKI
jgi:hypothetical protein